MSTPARCPKCSRDNFPSSKYCENCGNELASAVQPLPSAPLHIPVYTGKFSPTPLDRDHARLTPERRSSLNRTWTGLGLLTVGVIISPIPRFAIIAGLAIIVGVLLIFLSSRFLGGRHRGFAKAALILVVIGLVAAFAGGAAVGAMLALDVANGTADLASALTSAFLWFYIIVIIADAFSNVGLVLITYDLQDSTGRTLLWSAFSLEIVIDAIIAFIVILNVQANAPQVLRDVASVADAFAALQDSFALLRLLLWIPAIPYAIAFYRARSQVDKRVIVADRTGPTTGPSR